MSYPENSLFYWYPKIKDIQLDTGRSIPMPKTLMMPFTEGVKEDSYKLFDGKEAPIWEAYIKTVQHQSNVVGFPLFMRSDQTSHKHGWENTCYVTDVDQIPDHAYQIQEFTEMAGMMGRLDIDGFVLREFLELDAKFTAFHGKMPIAREFRFFVKDGRLQCYHPYWFPACMVRPSVENWLDILMEMEKISDNELKILTEWAEAIGKAVGYPGTAYHSYWSVDFCQLRDGTWAMTDMAIGEDSFHFNTCTHAQESMKGYPDPYEVPKPRRDYGRFFKEDEKDE